MSSAKAVAQPTKRSKAFLYVMYLFVVAVLFLAGAEAILRMKGIEPWRIRDVDIQVDPGGRFFTKHPTLGYTHIPGQFTITLSTGYSFRVTHLPNTLRITQPLASYDEPSHKQEIWIFGCSYTHGWILNDNETYPWKLQARLPEYKVINFGVSGYGTIHALIQFREALEEKAPKVAILAYARFHDYRNTFLRARRKTIAPWNRLGPLVQPYARLDKEGGLQYFFAEVEYTEFPMMRHLALAHFIEMKWNQIENKLSRSHDVSEALVMEMASLAKRHEVRFVIASITAGGREMMEFAERNEIPSVDISVDLSVERHTNLPHDRHPSPAANDEYADRLEAYLRQELLQP